MSSPGEYRWTLGNTIFVSLSSHTHTLTSTLTSIVSSLSLSLFLSLSFFLSLFLSLSFFLSLFLSLSLSLSLSLRIVVDIVCGENGGGRSKSWEERFCATQTISSILSHGRKNRRPSNNLLSEESKGLLPTMIDMLRLLTEDDNGSVREGACQAACSLLQMSLASEIAEKVVEGGEGGESKNGGASSRSMSSLASTLLSKMALKDASSDVRAEACVAVMKVARDERNGFLNSLPVRKVLMPAVVTCAMGKNARLRTAADRALFFCFEMGRDVETLESRVRQMNKTVLRDSPGGSEMVPFLNRHWQKVCKMIPESTWDL